MLRPNIEDAFRRDISAFYFVARFLERLFAKSILLYKQILRLKPDFQRAETELAKLIERHREVDPESADALTSKTSPEDLDAERAEDEQDWDWTDLGEEDEWGDMFDVMDGAAQGPALFGDAEPEPAPEAQPAAPAAATTLPPPPDFSPIPAPMPSHSMPAASMARERTV